MKKSAPLVLVLNLEAELVIQSAADEIRCNVMFRYSWLTGLPIEEVVGGTCKPGFFRLIPWSGLCVLEVNERVAEVRLGAESCCLFQWIVMAGVKASLNARDCLDKLALIAHILLVHSFRWLQVGKVVIVLGYRYECI